MKDVIIIFWEREGGGMGSVEKEKKVPDPLCANWIVQWDEISNGQEGMSSD